MFPQDTYIFYYNCYILGIIYLKTLLFLLSILIRSSSRLYLRDFIIDVSFCESELAYLYKSYIIKILLE